MINSIRAKILVISTSAVMFSLILTGVATYTIVRSNTLDTIEQNLDAITAGNVLAVEKWVASKALAVSAAAEEISPGDPQGIVLHMSKANGFPVTTVGWSDKSFISSSSSTPRNYDPTGRPWYKAAAQAGKPIVTKPYGDSATGEPFVSFAAPIMRNGSVSGAISGAVPLQGVRDVVAAVRPTPQSLGFVISDDGQIIAHPDAKLLLKPTSELSSSLTPQAISALAGATKPLELSIEGVQKLLKAKPVAGTDWYLVVALDKNEATAGLQNVLSTSAITTLLLGIAAACLSFFFTAQVFRRLSLARDAMHAIGSGGGDLTHRLPVVGRDEVAQISESFNSFIEKIGLVLREIRTGAESMTVAAREIDSGNLDLSRRTEISASNLEETSASLTQLTSSVQQSATSAAQATELASSASRNAAMGGEVVTSAVQTMNEIAKSSEKISEITSVIDGIAFQTNILALNAAVEAARAGEHGRGFAVVASEVRNLAQRSAIAAKEIKTLIATSEASVASGTTKVRAAGKSMNEIVQSIQRVTGIMSEINEAMTEQSIGICQINESVAVLDQSTQQNAALVEQSASASSMLHGQAERLSNTVGTFTLE